LKRDAQSKAVHQYRIHHPVPIVSGIERAGHLFVGSRPGKVFVTLTASSTCALSLVKASPPPQPNEAIRMVGAAIALDS